MESNESEIGPYDWKRGDLHCRKHWDTIDLKGRRILHHACMYKRYHHGGWHVCSCGERKRQLTRKLQRVKSRAAQ